MREETTESRGKLSAFVRGLFGNNPNCKHEIKPEMPEQLKQESDPEKAKQFWQLMVPMTAKVPDYKNINAPMSVEEMKVCMVPVEWRIRDMSIGSICIETKRLHSLFQRMDEFLELSRRISREPADAYKRIPAHVSTQIRVGKIQEQMRAIRFRLEIRDYSCKAEMQILKDRLYQLYGEAKVIDPEGTARYERMIDKQMRRAR